MRYWVTSPRTYHCKQQPYCSTVPWICFRMASQFIHLEIPEARAQRKCKVSRQVVDHHFSLAKMSASAIWHCCYFNARFIIPRVQRIMEAGQQTKISLEAVQNNGWKLLKISLLSMTNEAVYRISHGIEKNRKRGREKEVERDAKRERDGKAEREREREKEREREERVREN